MRAQTRRVFQKLKLGWWLYRLRRYKLVGHAISTYLQLSSMIRQR